MITLAKGRKLPQTGDRGSIWFKALEDNTILDDAHFHNGINSEKLNAYNVIKSATTILVAAWSADLGGANYEQTITVPDGVILTNDRIWFSISGGADDGTVVFPTVKRLTTTTYNVRVNDNTMALIATYG